MYDKGWWRGFRMGVLIMALSMGTICVVILTALDNNSASLVRISPEMRRCLDVCDEDLEP